MSKKILFITAFPPCNITAGQYYSLRLILDLIGKGYIVDIIYFDYPEHKIDSQIEKNVIECFHPSIMNCLKRFYYNPTFSRRYSKNVLKRICSIKDNYDILYFDFSQTFFYAKKIEHKCKVLMCHDVICQKVSRQNKLLYWITRWNEKTLLASSNSHIFTFSSKDCNIIKNIYGKESYHVNFYLKREEKESLEYTCLDKVFCLYGSWNRKENSDGLLWFIKNVLPFLEESIKIIIIGGGIESITLPNDSRIKPTGFVDKPTEIIETCQALIAPLFSGAGVKVKVIDSLTTGTPVIGTCVALEGISANERLLFENNSADDFIKTINQWDKIDAIQKIELAKEFIKQYNNNHFPEYISRL